MHEDVGEDDLRCASGQVLYDGSLVGEGCKWRARFAESKGNRDYQALQVTASRLAEMAENLQKLLICRRDVQRPHAIKVGFENRQREFEEGGGRRHIICIGADEVIGAEVDVHRQRTHAGPLHVQRGELDNTLSAYYNGAPEDGTRDANGAPTPADQHEARPASTVFCTNRVSPRDPLEDFG